MRRRRPRVDVLAELPAELRRCTGDAARWWLDLFAWCELAGVDSLEVVARVAWADGSLVVA